MTRKLKQSRKKLVLLFLEYGFHFWLLIFICNVLIFYAFRFFIMASTDKPLNTPAISVTPIVTGPPTSEATESASPTAVKRGRPPTSTPSPTPVGPVINLNFSMPGIGTNGGNLNPLHTERKISVFIYSPDSDSGDNRVRPLSTIKTQAVYDSDPNSPTYTYFVNPYIDLGAKAAELDTYQLAFKAPQALMQVIKDPDSNSPGGKIFKGRKRFRVNLPTQYLVSGDIYPTSSSDNIMDINDFNLLTNCFESRADSGRCLDRAGADLDDNGIVDGVDYNLMLLSFKTLLSRGYPIPTAGETKKIVINPTGTAFVKKVTNVLNPSLKPTIKPTAIPVKRASGGAGGLIVFFVILIIVGTGLFIAYKRHLLDGLLKKSKKVDMPGQEAAVNSNVQTENAAVTPPSDNASMEAKPLTEVNSGGAAGPTTVFSNEDQTVNSAGSDNANIPPPQDKVESTSQNAGISNDSGMVEKSGYLKKGKPDEQGNGYWVTLADDSGITRGFYQGKNIEDGFAKIKGTMKNDEENKPFIQIAEITPEE